MKAHPYTGVRARGFMGHAMVTIFFAAVIANDVHADVLSYETFDTSPGQYTTGLLTGQPLRGTGYDPGGSWIVDPVNVASSGAPEIFSGSLAYTGFPTVGGRAGPRGFDFRSRGKFDVSSGGVFDQRGLVEGGLIGGGSVSDTIYLSFLGASSTGSRSTGSTCCFGTLQLNAGSGGNLLVGKRAASANYAVVATGASSDIGTPGTPIDLLPHLFVVRIDFMPGADDNIIVWIDPDLGSSEAGQLASISSTVTGNAAFDSIALRSGNVFEQWEFDEIRISTTFNPFAVPEPATLALMAFGLAVLGWRHRV